MPTASGFRSAYIVLGTTKVGRNILEDIFAGRGPKGIAEKRKEFFVVDPLNYKRFCLKSCGISTVRS